MDHSSHPTTGEYSGNAGSLFRLVFTTSLLTLLTLGIYRFWAKTRLRKYIWSSVSADGDSFEYTGTGLEKFVGFLIAVVILAVYLGIIQMALFFFGLNLFTVEPSSMEEALAQMAAFYITILAVVPLWYFAQYRSRRYKLARTRWRGIRFGAESGAWGYAFRAIGHSILTGLTLGLLLPRQTFSLEKYVTDRSWYGNAQFTQEGHWAHLYPAMKHLFIGACLVIAGGVAGVVFESPVIAAVLGVVGYLWGLVGFVHYRVASYTYTTNHKKLGSKGAFYAEPQTSYIVKTLILGTAAVSIIAGIIFAAASFLLTPFLDALAFGEPSPVLVGVLVVGYVGALLLIGALSMIWVTQPILAHIVRATWVRDMSALTTIRQREADEGADAEGFAEALDVGGAF